MTDYSQPLRPVEKYLILAARYFFGGHALISGANYFLKFLPDLAPRDPEIAVRFIHVMIDTHLYDLVKVMEVLTGLSLLSGVFMAPILVMEMPVTVVILYLSWFIAPTPRSIYTGPRELLLNLFLLSTYWGYFRPLVCRWNSPLKLMWRDPSVSHLGKEQT